MNKINWQNETDKIISTLGDSKPKLLLHACCAPCSSASLEYLVKYFDIGIIFYNPNISTEGEFNKRLNELKRFVSQYPFTQNIAIIAPQYDHREFLDVVKGLEDFPEGGDRCKKCFELRLSKAREVAKTLNYDYFATTLTISPLKNTEVLNKIGLENQDQSVLYLPTDLKKKGRYLRSIELSKEYDLYRQDFCGCEFSLRDRIIQKKESK